MKYTKDKKPLQCYMRQSTWYKEAVKNGKVLGICWHDTGAGNPYLKRYVQPDDNASNRAELISKIGTNAYRNDWNHASVQAGVNAFIGTFADGTVGTVEVGPNTTHAWGVGGGSKGSLNGYKLEGGRAVWTEGFWLQFEICDDGYSDKAYFEKCYKEAVEYTAYICKLYGLDPKGTVTFNGVKVPVITCHKQSYDLGLGSGHSDVMIWFNKFKKTMDDVRNDVAKLIKESEVEVFKYGEKSLGVFAAKSTLIIGKLLGLKEVPKGVEDNNGYGDGVDADIRAIQKASGLKEKGEIDEATIRAARKLVEAKIKSIQTDLTNNKNKVTSLSKDKTDLESKVKKLNEEKAALQKKLDEANSILTRGDVDKDGNLSMKDVLLLRKLIAGGKK